MGGTAGRSCRIGLGRLAACCAILAVASAWADEPAAKRVVLTIDDGPRAFFINRALDIFDRYGVKVTFFHCGNNLAADPTLAARCAERGHEVENHSYSHPFMPRLSADAARSQLVRTSTLIERQTGRRPQFFRPPYGAHNRRVDTISGQLGMDIALWTIDPYDWQGSATASRTTNRILSHLHNNAVILIHEAQPTLQALPAILQGAQRRGYEFVTYSELMSGEARSHAIVVPCDPSRSRRNVAARCADILARNYLRATLPAREQPTPLQFAVRVPRGREGTLRIRLLAAGGADGAQKLSVNGRAVGVFQGAPLVQAALTEEQTAQGEVSVTVAGVGNATPRVASISFRASEPDGTRLSAGAGAPRG